MTGCYVLQADWIISINRPPANWPSAGAIVFDNYGVRYREGLDLVLRNITCVINGGEKVSYSLYMSWIVHVYKAKASLSLRYKY